MEGNLQYWELLSQPPKNALKPIAAGRMKGKTDINPQWRYKAMTETFGVIGIGWKYTINKLWTEPGADGEVMAFANVSVFVNVNGKWSDAIEGIGGSSLVTKERSGMYNNDEAFKMAVTDALSVALKMLGVAADIYMGIWDGSKYGESIEGAKDPKKKNAEVKLDDLKAKIKSKFAEATKEQRAKIKDMFLQYDEKGNPSKINDMAKLKEVLANVEKIMNA